MLPENKDHGVSGGLSPLLWYIIYCLQFSLISPKPIYELIHPSRNHPTTALPPSVLSLLPVGQPHKRSASSRPSCDIGMPFAAWDVGPGGYWFMAMVTGLQIKWTNSACWIWHWNIWKKYKWCAWKASNSPNSNNKDRHFNKLVSFDFVASTHHDRPPAPGDPGHIHLAVLHCASNHPKWQQPWKEEKGKAAVDLQKHCVYINIYIDTHDPTSQPVI